MLMAQWLVCARQTLENSNRIRSLEVSGESGLPKHGPSTGMIQCVIEIG